jgi:hypothetical protein
MQKRRRFKQTETLEQRLTEEAAKLRKEAQGTPPGLEVNCLSSALGRPKRPPI